MPGLPVHLTFRVRETRWALFSGIGLAIGACAAFALRGYGWTVAVSLIAVGIIAGWLASTFFVRDRCVERGCGAVIPRGATHCPRCGSSVIGVLAVGGTGNDQDA